MKYSDPVQDLYINLKPGEQLLNGDKAEQLCRFRSYAEGDLKRTDVQKAFLSALIEQKLTAANIIKAPEVFLLLSKNTKTNFTLTDLLGNIEALKMLKAGNVQSYDMPGTPQNIGGASYFIIDAKKARTLCAEHFNGDYELTQ